MLRVSVVWILLPDIGHSTWGVLLAYTFKPSVELKDGV